MLGDVTESLGWLLSTRCVFIPHIFAKSSNLTYCMKKLCINTSIFLFFQYQYCFYCIFVFLNTIYYLLVCCFSIPCIIFLSCSEYLVFEYVVASSFPSSCHHVQLFIRLFVLLIIMLVLLSCVFFILAS